jgi:transposase-like protein
VSETNPEGQRAVPYLCPFCGEEDLRPVGGAPSGPSRWGCRSCLRVFAVQFFGLHSPDVVPTLSGVEQP